MAIFNSELLVYHMVFSILRWPTMAIGRGSNTFFGKEKDQPAFAVHAGHRVFLKCDRIHIACIRLK